MLVMNGVNVKVTFWLYSAIAIMLPSCCYFISGASFLVIMAHASFYRPETEEEPFDAEMEPV